MRLRTFAFVVACSTACANAQNTAAQNGSDTPKIDDVRYQLGVLAHDSLMGRRTGTPGSLGAARFIAAQLESFGIEPAGDDGFFQFVPLQRVVTESGRERFQFLPDLASLDEGGDDKVLERNVVGVIRGTDPELRDQVVIVGAHFDHVGVRNPVEGDSVYNGADDDASGVVATLEIARALSQSPPRRTVVFLLSTGEEVGLLGTRWYIDHPFAPMEETVADLQIEMIGRPDSLAGGAGNAWLTGYERSTMGDMLKNAGNRIVPDPRPDQNFFERSDNIAFAVLGIPAHTLSSFGLHADYHQPSDEVEMVDFDHMTSVIEMAIGAVRLLADSDDPPAWHPGGRPERR
ncbi:MAG: M20/M25/M40 family metallo-hydrolase [Gemmatimonadota bacterium]|nr:M20/M25/M40 family metallo-hydrolase [Gemmatimonadota bacterium]